MVGSAEVWGIKLRLDEHPGASLRAQAGVQGAEPPEAHGYGQLTTVT